MYYKLHQVKLKQYLDLIYDERLDRLEYYMNYVKKKNPQMYLDHYDEIRDYIAFYYEYRTEGKKLC